ncbi:MAG: class I SAM-dependent methyltransferase [Burkholderiales bacterium]
MQDHHPAAPDTPSAWVQRWHFIARPGCRVLDLACGHGRHARYFARLGHPVHAVDRDAEALAALQGLQRVSTLQADLENGPWPLGGLRFGCIVVTNYLHRPLFPAIIGALADDGLLLYETFAAGNEHFGKPSNPAFLLKPSELLEAVRGRLRVIAFEDVCLESPAPAMVQRIAACGPRLEPAWGQRAAPAR